MAYARKLILLVLPLCGALICVIYVGWQSFKPIPERVSAATPYIVPFSITVADEASIAQSISSRFEPNRGITWYTPRFFAESNKVRVFPYVGAREREKWIRLVVQLRWDDDERWNRPTALRFVVDGKETRFYLDRVGDNVISNIGSSVFEIYDLQVPNELLQAIATAKHVELDAEGDGATQSFQIPSEEVKQFLPVISRFITLDGTQIVEGTPKQEQRIPAR